MVEFKIKLLSIAAVKFKKVLLITMLSESKWCYSQAFNLYTLHHSQTPYRM